MFCSANHTIKTLLEHAFEPNNNKHEENKVIGMKKGHKYLFIDKFVDHFLDNKLTL